MAIIDFKHIMDSSSSVEQYIIDISRLGIIPHVLSAAFSSGLIDHIRTSPGIHIDELAERMPGALSNQNKFNLFLDCLNYIQVVYNQEGKLFLNEKFLSLDDLTFSVLFAYPSWRGLSDINLTNLKECITGKGTIYPNLHEYLVNTHSYPIFHDAVSALHLSNSCKSVEILYDIMVRNKELTRLCDIGCGNALLSLELAEKYPFETLFLIDQDISAAEIMLRKKRPSCDVECHELDVSCQEIPESDVYLCVNTLSTLADDDIHKVLLNVKKCKPNNSILIIKDVIIHQNASKRQSPLGILCFASESKGYIREMEKFVDIIREVFRVQFVQNDTPTSVIISCT